MISTNEDPPADSDRRKLPAWLVSQLRPARTDFSRRFVCLAKDAKWLDTALPGVQIRIMEYIPNTRPRLAAQLRFQHGHSPMTLGYHPDLEVLLQHGQLSSAKSVYKASEYFRLPTPNEQADDQLVVQRAASMRPDESALLYLAAGQMQQSDTESRQIDTTDEGFWFAGPIEGTDVLPLHGHGSGNVMLVRWNKTAAFRTRIDPRGEELLVLDGAVYDAQGHYPAGSWIRNPLEAWQYWGAKAGTMMYYKNGHFADADTAA